MNDDHGWVEESRKCIQSVTRGLFGGPHPDCRLLGENLIKIAELHLYHHVGFATFDDWVLGPQPNGLQLREVATSRRLRTELLAVDLHGAWAAVLPRIVRGVGYPKRVVLSGDFNRFWPADDSDTGIDRRIMKLHRNHPEIYDRLIKLEITFKEAVKEAGIVRPNRDNHLHTLMSMWNKAPRETQDTFLTWVLGPNVSFQVNNTSSPRS